MKYIKIVITALTLLLATSTSFAQTTLQGRVIDRLTKDAITGVSVVVDGTVIGTSTDANGSYSITIPEGEKTLTFSLLGYKSQTINTSGKTTANIELEEDSHMIDAVIKVGYITNTKRELTTAISSLSDKDLTGITSPSLEQAIQGLVPGVQIGTSNGTPGSPMSFNIRGIGSVSAGSSPLTIIDDVIIENGLKTLNINDVKNIQILKDAASTAIYGAAGANGVIIVTTKSGTKSAPTVNFEAKMGMSEVERFYKMMNAQECMDLMDEAGVAYWSIPGFDPNIDTDWQKVITRKAFVKSYSVSLRGGSEKTGYSISGSYYDQPGVVLNSDYKRFTARAKFDFQVNNWLKFNFTVSPSYEDKNEIRDRGQQGVEPVMTRTLQMPPMFPVYYEGKYWTQNNYSTAELVADPRDPTNPAKQKPNAWPIANVENPLKLLEEQAMRTISRHVNASIGFDAQITKNLVFRPRFSYDARDSQLRYWRSAKIGARPGRETDGDARLTTNMITKWESENVLIYTRTFNADHKLTAAAGASFSERTHSISGGTAKGFGSDALPTINGGTSFTTSDLPYLKDKAASFYARANYTLKEKYMFSAIVRVDGSSVFGPNKRFGVFPSASAGWIASEEKFMKWAKPALSILKLRASWGMSGNNAIGRYRYVSFLGAQNYVFGGEVANGFAPDNIANPNLAWEQKESFNVGLDLGLFSDRLFFTMDLYRDVTSNMLLETNIPATLGQPTMMMNIGSVQNKGIELSLSAYPVSTNNFRWNSRFNISFNRNKVLSLSTNGDAIYDGYDNNSNITTVGKSIGMFYGRVYKGVYMSWDEIRALAADPNSGFAFDPATIPGDGKFVDLNGDGVVDDDDRTIIGSPHPKFVLGFSNTFSYKNLSLSFLLTGQYGNQIYNYTLHPMARSANSNAIKDFTKRYRNDENRGNGWYGIVNERKGAEADRNKFSNFQLEDGSYLRIRNISLSYNFPKKILNTLRLKGLVVGFNIDNLYTFTHYTGMNVEAQQYGSDGTTRATAMGLDYTSYPTPRTYTLSVNLTF